MKQTNRILDKGELDALGLNKRAVIKQSLEGNFTIVKVRKSRIIMKDAKDILEVAQKLKTYNPNAVISLEIGGPICSKSVAFLEQNKISIHTVQV